MSSTEVTTQPATGWVALSAGDRHLIVQGSSSVAADLQGPLEAGVVEVLEALARDGLGALPDFALVDTSGEQARVLVRGSAVVSADGSAVTSNGRMPWADLDVDAAAIALGEGSKGGWRRPTRLGRPAVAVPAVVPVPVPVAEAEPEAEPELGGGTDDEVLDEPVVDVAPDLEPEPEAAPEPEPEAQEAAAPEPQPQPEPVPEPESAPEPAPEPEPAPLAEEAPELSPAALAPPVPPADLTLPPSEEYAGSAPAARIPPVKPATPDKKVLIDSVPWRTLPEGGNTGADTPAESGSAAEPMPAAAPVEAPPVPMPAPEPGAASAPDPAAGSAPEPAAADGPTGPDNWGMTGPSPMQAPSGQEAVPEPVDAPATVAPPVPDVTMDRSALSPGTEGPADSPVVLAVICPAGHHSSPHASNCRVCGRDIPTQQPFQTPRPQLGTLVVSTGGLVPLDRGILLGRAPKVNADLPPSSRPHLVRLASRDNDISRNHAEVILEGWHVLVRDLGSTNGTTVTLPGQEPVRLRPTEDFGIEPGAVLTLADEVSLTYEVSE